MIYIIGTMTVLSNINDPTQGVMELPGFFVSTTLKIEGLDSYLADTTSNMPAFEGVKTYFYKFNSEQQAKLLLNWSDESGFQPFFKTVHDVPAFVTRRQARQQLLLMGLLDNVDPTIASIPDTTARRLAEIYWQDATDFDRNNPYLLSIAAALGLTPEQLDDAFIAAEAL